MVESDIPSKQDLEQCLNILLGDEPCRIQIITSFASTGCNSSRPAQLQEQDLKYGKLAQLAAHHVTCLKRLHANELVTSEVWDHALQPKVQYEVWYD